MNSDESSAKNGQSLERSLGLLEALTIGVGTMIGAGIFVFPGVAAGKTGLSATLSYLIGALIALLVALPTSELATAMPESGGGYYFVSRGLGPLFGTVVGLGQWLGLMFATAFYLMGLSVYLLEIVQLTGLSPGGPVNILSIVMCCLLTGVNIWGTSNSGMFQNVIVLILLAILSIFISYGLMAIFGPISAVSLPEKFTPYGYLPIFTTSALIFTSYLGFAQIATVAGEIKDPSRTLPLAMVGSVLIVGILYILAVLVCNSVFGAETLSEYGETALIKVGEHFFGLPGQVIVMVGGLLSTVSSANASIMSSSRALYALSKDSLVPKKTSRVSDRFGTPYISLILTGSVILLLIIVGHLEILAEIASLLHLTMYGLICIALLVLRHNQPEWYKPKFQLPYYRIIASTGALASFTIIFFMKTETMISGFVVLCLTILWHFVYVQFGRSKSHGEV